MSVAVPDSTVLNIFSPCGSRYNPIICMLKKICVYISSGNMYNVYRAPKGKNCSCTFTLPACVKTYKMNVSFEVVYVGHQNAQ